MGTLQSELLRNKEKIQTIVPPNNKSSRSFIKYVPLCPHDSYDPKTCAGCKQEAGCRDPAAYRFRSIMEYSL
jgi:hypothetical protein